MNNDPLAQPLSRSKRPATVEADFAESFHLPSAKVRPSVIKPACEILFWLIIAAAAVMVMIYPRQSLVNVLTAVKIVYETSRDQWRARQPGKPALTGGESAVKDGPAATGTNSGKGTPAGKEQVARAVDPRQPGAAGNGKTEAGPGSGPGSTVSPQAQGEGQGQAAGEPLVVNTPTGATQPFTPPIAINMVVPPGGGGKDGPLVMPQQPGPAPSAIIINTHGGAPGGPMQPPVTVTQMPGGTGPGGGTTVQVNGGPGQTQPVTLGPGGRTGGGVSTVQVNGPGGGPAVTTTDTPPATIVAQALDSGPTAAAMAAPLTGSQTTPKDWPRSIAVRGTPEVMTLERGSGSAHQYVTMTEHYEFESDTKVGADVVRELSRIFEATYELNKALPLRVRPAPEGGRNHFVARLFSRDSAYFGAGGMPGSSGTYSRNQKCVLVPISSLGVKLVNGRMQTEHTDATDTLIHEITHQMMNRWLPNLPRWYAEGSADYVAMSDYVHGRFFLNQMEDRLRQYLKRRGQSGSSFPMLRPAELMALDPKTWGMALASNAASASQNYASATLLTYYFYHLDGKGDTAAMLRYLEAIDAGTPEYDAAAEHLLHGRTVEELEADVQMALQNHGLPVVLVSRGGPVWKPSAKGG